MPQELKTHVLSFVDSLAIEKKGALYNSIISHLEQFKKTKKPVDVFSDDKPVVRIHHKPLEECESCSA